MTDETHRQYERRGSELPANSPQVTTTPTQLLTGLTVGLLTNRVICTECATQLTEGQAITVSGYRKAECTAWDLQRCYCPACAPATVQTPTLGVAELLARAYLATVARPRARTNRLCLSEVELVAYSPPNQGGVP